MSELIVDSFAGGGGASLGIEWATGRSPDIAINHDPEAIALHSANHPGTTHYCEDVWQVDPVEATRGKPVGLMWLSPDCKHFSKAKGGKPVSKKIRGLAWIAARWAAAVRPRVLILENVEEFQTWGPLNEETQRPCPARKGLTFRRFVSRLRNLGYQVEWRELRACDYGAPTIRKRLFLIARCDGQPIIWPNPTHGRGTQHDYRVASECIDWTIPCPSIFERKKPLSENTLNRIARGLKRFVLDSPQPFIVPIDNLSSGSSGARGSTDPLSTVTAEARHALVSPFLAKHFGGNYSGPGTQLDLPMHTVTSVDHHALVTSHLCKLRNNQYGQSVDDPIPTLTAGGGHVAEVRAFLITYYGNEQEAESLFDPIRTVTARDRFGLVTVAGVDYQIVDIGMRMLAPRELYRAQGFPDSYKIDIEYNGKPLTKTAQVRMCGNSVCPPIAQAIVNANYFANSKSALAA